MNLLIEDVAEFMSNVEERRISPAEAKAITLHKWMTTHFQALALTPCLGCWVGL